MNRVRPKKVFGQHFLIDKNLLDVIGRLAALHADDTVLEIGPGLGVLTRYLAGRVAHVHAVEIDRSLELPLCQSLTGHANVSLVWADALRVDLSALEPQPTKLVANLPYSIATPLIAESLTGLTSIAHWCVMVQREVADRFFASPSTKGYGAVSVLLQLATRRTGFHPVSRHAFKPPPNVDSALVAFSRLALPAEFPEIKRVVEAAFAHRRKTLPNTLALGGIASRQATVEALLLLGKRADVRAEALAPTDFVALRQIFRENDHDGAGRIEDLRRREPEGAG